jgi:Spy/CpxP family protein refolding chaperone
MKRLSSAVLIAALTAFSATSLYAAAPDSPAGPHKGDHEQNRAAHAQKNLDELQQQLHLKDNQQAAWSQYKAFVLTAMSEREKQHAEHRPDAAGADNSSTPERLQKLATELRTRAAALEKFAAQTDVFYKTLSPEQKTIFDLHARHHHPRRHW